MNIEWNKENNFTISKKRSLPNDQFGLFACFDDSTIEVIRGSENEASWSFDSNTLNQRLSAEFVTPIDINNDASFVRVGDFLWILGGYFGAFPIGRMILILSSIVKKVK